MSQNGVEMYQAKVDAVLKIIAEIKSFEGLDLINALTDLLKVTEPHAEVAKEVESLAMVLLDRCKEELDPQLIAATANLIKAMNY